MTAATLFIKIAADWKDATAGFRSVADEMGAMVDNVEKKFSKISSLADGLVSAGTALTAGVTAPLVGVGVAAVKVSEDLNMAKLAFTTMLGSAEKANTFLKELQAFAASTPFEFPDLVDASKRMMAMGFAAKDVVPTMRAIGDAAAALGGGKSFIDGITTALGQMQAKGKVSAEEMNQLAERGVPAWQMLADKIGTGIPEAMKLAEKGAISASVAIPAILEGMNEKFGGQMSKASQTLTGVWSNFKDQTTLVLAELGNTLAPVLLTIVQAALPLLEWVKSAVEWFGQLPQPVQAFALTLAALAAALGPVLLAAGGLATAITALMPALTAIGAFFGVSVVALGGWAVAIAAVLAGLVALGVWVHSNWEPIVTVIRQAWDGITEIAKAAWDAYVLFLTTVWGSLLGLAMAPFTALRSAIDVVWDGLSSIWGSAWDGIKSALTGVWESLKGAASSIWDPVVKFFGEIWDWIKTTWKTAWEGIKSNLGGVWDSIKGMAVAAWGKVTEAIRTFMEWAAKIPGVNKLMNLDEAWNSAKKLEDQTKNTTNAVKDHTTKANDLKAAHAGLAPVIGATSAAKTKARTETTTYSAAMQILIEKARLQKQEFQENIRWLAQYQFELSKGNDLIANKLYATLDGLRDRMDGNARLLHDASSMKLPAWTSALGTANAAIPPFTGNIGKVQTAVTDLNIKGTQEMTAFRNSMSKLAGDLSEDITNKLFRGQGSWVDIGKTALNGLANAFRDQFIKPATDAVTNFIGGALADLLGGKGLGGVLDRLGAIGDAMGRVFGGGGVSVPGLPGGGSAPSPTGAPGGGAGAAGAIGGLAGVFTAIGSIGSMISGIVGNFQNAKMETTLNAIENSTRYVKIWTGEQSQSILWSVQTTAARLEYVNNSLDDIKGHIWELSPMKVGIDMLNTSMDDIKGTLWKIESLLVSSIAAPIVEGIHYLADVTADAARAVIETMMMQQKSQPLVVNVSMSQTFTTGGAGAKSPQQIGYEIADQLIRNLKAKGALR